MDRKKELRFTYENLEVQEAGYKGEVIFDRDVVGDFSIQVGERTLYYETGFLLVEFSQQIKVWLSGDSGQDKAFLYESLESDIIGLIWIMKSMSGWQIGSPHETYAEKSSFSLKEIQMTANEYSRTLELDLFRLGFDGKMILDT